MCTRLVALAASILVAAAHPSAQAEPVDIELVFAADGSGSIDDEELAFQRAGYAAAITNPKVLSTIQGGFYQKIAVAYVEWGSAVSQHTIVDWTVIDGLESARAFADKLISEPRQAIGYNSISEAIAYSQNMIETNDLEGVRRIIDVSADSGNYGGRPILMARGDAVSANITINGLVINRPGSGLPGLGPGSLAEYFELSVIGGFGAFVVVAQDRAEFADAILKKMILEIAEPGSLDCDSSTPPHDCRLARR